MNDLITLIKEQTPNIQAAINSGALYGSDLFHRFIKYTIVTNIIGLFFGLICFGVAYKSYMLGQEIGWESYDYRIGIFLPMAIAGCVLGLGFVISSSIDLIKAIYIPEALLLDLIK